ncbi:hypothetical protein B0A52_01831 [Exophiala mesophila]|uniref:Uncharacterized protein n=1 Tax=Exophiala mesophila TaxID=212818 RepID=A0A438NG53_EXOME|nr:hypothetical protein B0A52_01831 [Exophiala mesophila]
MALAMESSRTPAQDIDMMDIELDIDGEDYAAPIGDEFQLEEGEEPSFVPSSTAANTSTEANLIPAIYTEDPNDEAQWNKIHIRGVDEFSTEDIITFANDHYIASLPEPRPEVRIQWIDDTSANIVFRDGNTARTAILSFLQNPITPTELANAPFEQRTAKAFSSRPASMLVVRIAQVKDRKQRNARDASRYYLLHPDQDPTERMRREFANNRGGRGGDYGDYRRRRFDDREHRRRRDQDHDGGAGEDFSADMYDDNPKPEPSSSAPGRGRDLFSKASKSRRRSASPSSRTINSDEIDISCSDDDEYERSKRRRHNGYRDRTERERPYNSRVTNAGKELFSSTTSSSERRRNPTQQSDPVELFPTKTTTTFSEMDTSMSIDAPPSNNSTNGGPRPTDAANLRANAAAAKRLKADLLNATQTSPRSHHRRSHAMDAKNEEDLAERFARKSISLDSTKSLRNDLPNKGVELFPSNDGGGESNGGFRIKGTGGLSIKGRAEVKELFPAQYQRSGRNQGKELFDEPVREKRERRRAGDLFD